MWCYQKPGFEALLVSHLQRQQQCSQFCDTVLKTEGVSVPAHSCILSAISPILSSALSTMPPPPPGQSHLLEFRSLGTCTLLHLVRLLYSGEMAGEGEEEKREAVSAAAKLGIHGLVEVTKRDRQADVGVQTEPEAAEGEDEGRWGRWRREVRDGGTFLVQEAVSAEVQVDAAAPPHPVASFETIDVASLQSLGLTDPHLPPSHPYVPISVVYPLDGNQTHQHSTAAADFMQESASAGHGSVAAVAPPQTAAPPALLPFSSQETLCAVDPQSWWSGPQSATADEEWEDEPSEQFQGNIPGYINYFLNPDKKEASHRGRPRGRRRAREGGARRAGTGERGARRPPGRPRGGRLTQTVDVQEVGMSRLQKLFLQRWGSRPSRPGQGGGAAGRRLDLKTRELLRSGCQRRRGRSRMWDFNPGGDFAPHGGRGASGGQRGRRRTTQQPKQESHCVGPSPRGRAKPVTSLPVSSLPARFYNAQTLPASSPSLQRSSPSDMLSPAASYVSRSSPLVHATSVPPPPPAPPHNEDQPEHFDRLLEEVMMGLDILSNNSSASQFQLRAPTNCGSCASSAVTSVQNKQQGRTNGLLEAGPASSPVLQQQGEGELSEMLEHFLQSFEQQVAREEVEMGRRSDAAGPARSVQTDPRRNDEAGNTARRSRPREASPRRSAAPKPVEGTPVKRRKRRGKNVYRFTLEKKSAKRPASSKSKIVIDQRDKQLQQRPVVQLERSGPLPVTVNVQDHSGQSLEVKSQARTKTGPSSLQNQQDSKNRPASWSTKMYPIRSRLKEAQIDGSVFHERPFVCPQPPSAGLPGRKRRRVTASGQPASLPNGHLGSTPPATPPPDREHEKNRERLEKDEEEATPPQEASQREKKRGAESEGEASDDVTVAKRVCVEQMAQTACETCTPSSECADLDPEPSTRETDDIIDVETVSLSSLRDFLQGQEAEEKPVLSEMKLQENTRCVTDDETGSSGDELIDVDGDTDDGGEKDGERDPKSRTGEAPLVEPKPPPAHSGVSPGSAGSREEDKVEEIDVTGGSGPAPDPVNISWTESSEGEREEEEEEEDIDIVGEKTDRPPLAVLAAS